MWCTERAEKVEDVQFWIKLFFWNVKVTSFIAMVFLGPLKTLWSGVVLNWRVADWILEKCVLEIFVFNSNWQKKKKKVQKNVCRCCRRPGFKFAWSGTSLARFCEDFEKRLENSPSKCNNSKNKSIKLN